MKIVFLQAARRDLRAIGDWIARDDPRRAASFVAEIETKAASLGSMPRRGPVSHRTARGPVHKLVHGRYLIFYRLVADRVEILNVRHGAQRYPDLA